MVYSGTGCQIYLVFPPEISHKTAVQFAESGSLGNIACALLQSRRDGTVDRTHGEMLLRFAHAANIPLLLENDISAAADLGADGVHIPADEDLYTKARNALGDDAIVGVDCGLSRHAGLTLGEMGADYVAFSGAPGQPQCARNAGLVEIIRWWSQTVIVPCVAWDTSSGDAARRLAGSGADFVAMGAPIWSHPEGPATATAELSAQLTDR